VTVCVSPNGWSWLVHGRRLLVWRHKQVTGARSVGSCRELPLPPTDVAHSAKLVNVFSAQQREQQHPSAASTPSCVAVSPEGIIRFWPSIAHESSWSELCALPELQGQECCSLTDCQPVGSVLATTTSTVGLVYLTSGAGGGGVSCRMLKIPQGLLGGISRRMSNLFWGNVASGTEAVRP